MSTPSPAYAELHCLTNFTFLRGASHPEELVAQAIAHGYAALAVTDECSFAGVVRAHVAVKEADTALKLIIGTEVQLADGPRLVLLAMGRAGYARLSRLITLARRRADKGAYELMRADLADGLPDCLALLAPVYPALEPAALMEQAHWLCGLFADRAWLAVELHRGARDAEHTATLAQVSEATGLPLVAAGDVHMHRRARRVLQDVLTAIRLNVPLERAGHALYPNGERHLREPAQLARLYRPEWLAESLRIAERCHFSLDELRYQYPDDMIPPGEDAASCLRRLAEQGMDERWPEGAPAKVRALVERELAVIAELRYEPYFLTVYDIIRFARGRGILCQGRGSAANSAVCYCLGITSVDPARMAMLFERFVSKERDEPPDIDVDFEHQRREEVLQYVYERYGRERAALAATLITYRRKSAVRDVGKALGLSLDQVDRLAANVTWWDEDIHEQRLRENGFDPDNPVMVRLVYLVKEIYGFPRHLSQHVGGFVIAKGPVSELVPIENAAMEERTVIQWDKDDLDAMGLLKVDCLALGMLSAIHRSFDLIARHRGREFTLATVPAEDPAVYDMICEADTVGVFQIESRAQMSMLPRLKPRCFYDLVIEVAIVRPGPIQGQMVHPYLKRRQGLEPVSYPSEEVRAVVERTLGVPIFQEQVIKLAMVAAGFSGGEADELRRAIGSWRRKDKLQRFQQRLHQGMRARGYSEAFAQQIFQQIQGFGEYGFPESHSASFALLVYVSAWLKRHEPAAFTCALLNSLPMGFYAPSQLVQDAQRHGVEVRGVDVNVSDWDCTLEPLGASTVVRFPVRRDQPAPRHDLALRLGLNRVKGLSRAGAERLLAARKTQAFSHVQDLSQRAQLSRKDLKALADADALRALSGHRHEARWHMLGVESSLPLFASPHFNEPSPTLPPPREGRELAEDYASLALSLGRHPMALLRPQLRRLRCLPAHRLAHMRHGQPVRIGGLIVTRQHPSTGNGVIFLTLEDETGSANVIVWPTMTERFRKEVLSGRLLRISGELQREGQVIHVVAQHMEDHSALLGKLVTYSRDFC